MTAMIVLVGLKGGANPEGYERWVLESYAPAVSLTVVLVRIAWVFPATYLSRMLIRRVRERDPSPPWQTVMVVSWAGMRDVIPLAAALALPLTTNAAIRSRGGASSSF